MSQVGSVAHRGKSGRRDHKSMATESGLPGAECTTPCRRSTRALPRIDWTLHNTWATSLRTPPAPWLPGVRSAIG